MKDNVIGRIVGAVYDEVVDVADDAVSNDIIDEDN